jgi:peptide/nickel transport system permease protein
MAVASTVVEHRGATSDRIGRAAIAGLMVLSVALLVAPLLLTAGERDLVGEPFEHVFARHLLGTDSQGRDLFARTVLGLRTSWFSALAVVAIGVVIGAVIGLVAGFTGRWVDAVLMRATDAALALPGPLVALAVVAALGPGLRNTLIAVAATWWPWYARIVRGEVHRLRGRPFVEAARSGGIGRFRTALVHVLPGAFGPLIVAASLDVGIVMLVLAGLSFLGLGSPPPAAELGAMTSQGLTYLFNAPWIALVPAIALFGIAVLANLAGDALRDLREA